MRYSRATHPGFLNVWIAKTGVGPPPPYVASVDTFIRITDRNRKKTKPITTKQITFEAAAEVCGTSIVAYIDRFYLLY